MIEQYTNLSEKNFDKNALQFHHMVEKGSMTIWWEERRKTVITGRWGESMIRGFCWGMFFAAILAHFLHADTMLINLAQPYVPHIALTSAYYYLAFGVVGILFRVFK